MVELEQLLQHADGRLTIHRCELGVEVWRVQHVWRGIDQPAAPEGIAVPVHHADHRQKGWRVRCLHFLVS
ncbi:MAG: hypothetical protein ACXVXZ_13840 [Mycobacteriaceae bacterium]